MYIGDYFTLMSFEPRLVLPKRGYKLDPDSIPAIRFDQVSFKYPKAKRAVLHDVSFAMGPGEHVAIVGENGAGKSTLIKLLMRLYDPTSGTVCVDDRMLPDVQLDSWYAQLGFLFQDFSQFAPLSLRENVTLGAQSEPASAKRLERALHLADAQKFVKQLPGGVEQTLDPSYKGGTELSGGQWQRVALARSFYHSPNVLILDEPTSAIDAAAEYAIFNRLFKAQEGKSMIIISHRFSTVRRADRIIVLDQGRIVEQGTHQELMKLGGKYQQLFTLQAEGYRADT
jgi:ATP-binding cassette subfamily B protein